MKISLFYYSGAGNTQFIAKNLYKKLVNLQYKVELIRITSKSIVGFNQDTDMYIIGFPVYDLSAPELVQKLISNIQLCSKPIAYFCTKAFLSSDSILELDELSSSKGLISVATQDFYMPGTDALALFAKPRTRTERLLKSFHSQNIGKKLDNFIKRIERNTEVNISKKWYSYLSVLIPTSTKKSFHNQYSKYIPEFYSKKDICIECMVCVKDCPRENIRFEDGIKFDMNCDMCLRCLHHCPVDSIQLGNYTNGTVRYNKVEIKI